MSYNRFKNPRVYTDMISNLLGSGWRDLGNITMVQNDGSTAVTLVSGTEADLYDLNPANSVKIAKENQQFYIQIDTGMTTDNLAESNYIAILNHNLHDAGVVFKVEISDESAMNSGLSTYGLKVSNSGNHTKLINAVQNDTEGEIDPTENGWTLITWDTQEDDNRFIRITFAHDDGANTNFATDLVIGSIMYGEYFDFPHSPDLNVSTTTKFDGTKLKNSIGGNTYATTTFFGQPDWYKTLAWVNTSTSNHQTYSFEKRNGRINHSMNFSYLNEIDVWSPNSNSHVSTEWFDTSNVQNSFYNKVIGQHYPFLFSLDGTSTVEGDYGLYRLSSKEFQSSQSANNIWGVKLNIMETW